MSHREQNCVVSAFNELKFGLFFNGSKSYTIPDSEPVEDCAAAVNARPLDPCTGMFLCIDALSDDSYAIPVCTDRAGFCRDEAMPGRENFAYCDGIALHYFSSFSPM